MVEAITLAGPSFQQSTLQGKTLKRDDYLDFFIPPRTSGNRQLKNVVQVYSKEVLQIWNVSGRTVRCKFADGEAQIEVVLKDEKIVAVRPDDMIDLPREYLKDRDRLEAFLNESYIVLNSLSDGGFKVYFYGKARGGLPPTGDERVGRPATDLERDIAGFIIGAGLAAIGGWFGGAIGGTIAFIAGFVGNRRGD